MNGKDLSESLQNVVREAAARKQPLHITGSGSKHFYGRAPMGTALSIREHSGIVSYEPTELVITARAGTPLAEIEAQLAEHHQMLPFEPPHFGPNATLGGTIACALSGPRRPYTGAARDFVLGVKILNGKGDILQFGGQVMKNVAGFDISRLMVGALGTLGIFLEISLKVLPMPHTELTLEFETTAQEAVTLLNTWSARPLPLSAACHDGETLRVRVSGSDIAVHAAHHKIGGIVDTGGDVFWERVREHTHGFFDDTTPLWRLSLPPAAAPLTLPGQWFMDWGGAQRWLKTTLPAQQVWQRAAEHGGSATLFRNSLHETEKFQALSAPMATLHRRLKAAFDPLAILNPGRLYADL